MTVRPDPTFHASPRLAMEAPPEKLAFTLMLSPDGSQPDGVAVVNVDRSSPKFGKIVNTLYMPNKGDEFHHFGWNACSSAHWRTKAGTGPPSGEKNSTVGRLRKDSP